MKRMKTFFIYFILIVAFYLFSSLMISFAINTRMKIIQVENITPSEITEVTAKASGMDGLVNLSIENSSNEYIEKYIKVNCYSKDDVLLGTKYIDTEIIDAKEKKDYEIRFNYTRVKKVEVELVDEIPENTSEKDKKSDIKLSGVELIGILIVLIFI